MGKPKLLLPLDGKPIVRWSAERLLRHVDSLVVVTPPDDAAIKDALKGLKARFVINARPEDGQATSIAVGAWALPGGTDAVVIALADQPRVPDALFADLLALFRSSRKPVAAPVFRGVQGTPVVFDASLFDELRRLDGDAGARAVVRKDPARVATLAVDSDMPPDVDTPEDYARLV